MIKTYSFNNVKVEIDFKRKKVTSVVFKDEELIKGDVPFFTIKIRDRDGNKNYISSLDFNFVNYLNETAYYTHEIVDVELSINQVSNGLKWGVKVKNHTDKLIEQVELMSLGFESTLIEDGGKGEIIIPYNEGARITSLKRRDAGGFTYREVDYPSYGISYVYPNMISSPFMAYIVNGKGIYFGMHDPSFTPKHTDVREYQNALKTEMSVFANANYGEDYEMNFDSLMIFFEGDFYVACDIYRDYFYKTHRNNFKTIKEQYDELPSWYHESPVVVTYPVLGGKDSDTKMEPGGLYPYTNGLEVIDRFHKETQAKMMVVLMQWESTAPWAPPYVWPPYGDVDNFYQYRDELHMRGHYLGVYTSGFGWTNTSHRKAYDKTEEFNILNLKDIMCTDSNGFMKSTVVPDIRFGYDVCPALETSKQIFVDEANKMVNAGLDYVQILDQNHGGHPYACYSDKHGHIPAPGSWQVSETKKILNSIDKTKCLLGCESAASEPYLNELKFSDNRYIINYCVGEPIPIYAYLYHEFVNNFMGNQICYAMTNESYSLTYRMAYSFINGDMYTLIIDGDGKIHLAWCDDHIVDDYMPLTLIKNTNKWRTGKFMDFLHLGKMVKPLKYQCGKRTFGFTWGYEHTYVFDSVLSAAYTNGEETYQFFINYDEKDEVIKLPKGKYLAIFDSEGQLPKTVEEDLLVPALSVVAIKIS